MKVAIMQPYLLPYIGYWQLINAVDKFVMYDNIQFSKKGWIHRNNILLNGEKKLFSLPLKNDSDSLNIVDRFISNDSDKKINKIIRQIESAYSNAPYFQEVFPLIKVIFQNKERNLFTYIYNSVFKICHYLQIETKIILSSTLKIDHSLKAQDKVIALSKALNATVYINPSGGTKLYEQHQFKKENIELFFLNSDINEYTQFGEKFISHLSIIDILMFNSQESIKEMLNSYNLHKI